MKIRRYLAKDMRQALHQVRETQGPDAVILSSRRLGEEVEVVAAIDFDPEALQQAAVQSETDALALESVESHNFDQVLDRALNAQHMRDSEALWARGASGYARVEEQSVTSVEMTSELNALRRMLETQLAALAWSDLSRRAPVHTEVLKELTKIGVTTQLATEFISQLPARCELAEGQRLALGLFAHRIPTASERWMERGAMVALVGPTGVGKTTTIAKIAARWVMQHGARDLALVTTDNARIGAHEQLLSIGRLLGAPCYSVDNAHDLKALLADLDNRRMVLIDTAGVGQRDQRLAQELASLRHAHRRLETSLVLSANLQAAAVEESLVRFATADAKSCILTKLDEAATLGGALSAIARSQMPLAYVCDGQRIAEDIKPARAHQLVARALQLARNSGASADEDLLSRRFGGVSHAIA